jgi:hypothetical protein
MTLFIDGSHLALPLWEAAGYRRQNGWDRWITPA